jgi:polysaccharide pyruvyl transferase WcaK-like protein
VRILVDQSGYELLNIGDVAMLQSCVQRLSQQWPRAEIMVIAHASADLASYCPGATVIGRSGQSFARLIPQRHRPVWQSTVPYLSGRLSRGRVLRLQPRTAVQAVRAADVVVAAGGGYVTDTWRWHATGVLGVLSLAQRLGKPTAMFGQGIGPIRQWALRMQARAVLPRLAVLSLREGCIGPDLAMSLGASPDAVTVTGDDALELVDSTSAPDGFALGVNARVAGYAGVDPSAAAALGDVVLEAAATLRVPIVALPVSRLGADADLRAIRDMLHRGHASADVLLHDLTTPQDLFTATASCRAIVTGSYHAAVFSLAQGVPAVCVTNSSYYEAKFAGLRALFPRACFIAALDQPYFVDRLRTSIHQAWHLPVPQRAAARDAAVGLRDAGRAAYAQFRDAIERNAVPLTADSQELV